MLFCLIISFHIYTDLLHHVDYIDFGADAEGRQAYAIHWEPPPEQAYRWKNISPKVPNSLRIYECHVGTSGSEPKISSFNEFIEKVF